MKKKNGKIDAAPNQLNENARKGSKAPAKKIEASKPKEICAKSSEKCAAKKSIQEINPKRKVTLARKTTKASPASSIETLAIPATPAPNSHQQKTEPCNVVAEKKDVLTAKEMADIKKFKESLALLKADILWESFIKEQEDMLLAMEAILLPNMQSITRDNLRSASSNDSSSTGQHIGDAGSDAEVHNLTICLLGKDREQLMEISSALQRIRDGVYGICEISFEAIPKGRLQVRPFCRLTVKCQEEYEKKFGSARVYRPAKSSIVGYACIENKGESAIQLDENL